MIMDGAFTRDEAFFDPRRATWVDHFEVTAIHEVVGRTAMAVSRGPEAVLH